MKLFTINRKFYFKGASDIARGLGLKWNKDNMSWLVPTLAIVERLLRFGDEEAKEAYTRALEAETALLKRSESTKSNLQAIVPSGLVPYPYQVAGVDFLLSHPRALLGDDMGLGKTIQAIILCNHVRPKKILILCPASLKINWAREWVKWSTLDVVPKILNYDVLKKNSVELHREEYCILILDECQYLKNPKAQRTQEVFGKKAGRGWSIPPLRAKRVVALTGTPIVNRPIELWPILSYLLPERYNNKFFFASKYCGAKQTRFGWDFNGASNLDDLQKELRLNVMLRRMKAQVLPDLPRKIRQIIELDVNSKTKKYLSREKDLFGFGEKDLTDKEFRNIVKQMSVNNPGFQSLSEIRKETALLKVPMVITHIESCLESTNKLVIFCHHIEVAETLRDYFKKDSVLLIGKSSEKQRQKAVDRFQEGKVKLFIGNIKAAGVGITLTASSHVIFLEQSWTPADMSQAEDRCCRIGQENRVLVQHLVLASSLDYYMSKKIIEKQEIIERALDVKKVNIEDLPEDKRELLR
jgi:SWI/SNF-related matrix-associated actin-dependent regulator of chromatin subfamily A-like protein 1